MNLRRKEIQKVNQRLVELRALTDEVRSRYADLDEAVGDVLQAVRSGYNLLHHPALQDLETCYGRLHPPQKPVITEKGDLHTQALADVAAGG
jgi:hypothetical protein